MATILRSPRRRLLLLGMLLGAGAVAGALAGAPSPAGLQDAFAGSGVVGAVAVAALYAALTVALVPGSALTVAAGAIFGPVIGSLVSIAGALVGATAAFALSRRTARASVEQVQGERAARVQQRLRAHGLLSIIALRLIPLVPFNVLNYIAGSARWHSRRPLRKTMGAASTAPATRGRRHLVNPLIRCRGLIVQMPASTAPRPGHFIPAATADEHLVALAQNGDRTAFDELAARHSTRLRRVLFRITRDCDAAYDAVQEALMRAWGNIGRFEGRAQFSTWLTRIGINESWSQLPVRAHERRRRRRRGTTRQSRTRSMTNGAMLRSEATGLASLRSSPTSRTSARRSGPHSGHASAWRSMRRR